MSDRNVESAPAGALPGSSSGGLAGRRALFAAVSLIAPVAGALSTRGAFFTGIGPILAGALPAVFPLGLPDVLGGSRDAKPAASVRMP